MNKICIGFWKLFAIVWDVRPRIYFPRYKDYPIATTDISDEYTFPDGIKVLYEWDEKGYHWVVFSR